MEAKEVYEVMKAYEEFLFAFENVFHYDWEVTKDRISDPCFISGQGTFISPGCDDESDNWANRGALLSTYRQLKKMLGEPPVEE